MGHQVKSRLAFAALLAAVLIVLGPRVALAVPPILESYLSFSDITTANASTSKHGLMPKADGTSSHYWGGDATWHPVSGAGGGVNITQGSYLSLPGTCTTNDVYFTTDSYYSHFRCSATNTWTPFLGGFIAALPGVVSGWTGVNTGANWTATDLNGAVQLQITNNASLNWRLLTKSQPSTPYTLTFIWGFYQQLNNSEDTGVYFYDGTKLMGLEFLSQASTFTIRVEKITDVTHDASTAASKALYNSGNLPMVHSPMGTLAALGPLLYARIANSGTTLTFSYSLDNITWTSLFSESVGTFITPTKYGFGGVDNTVGSSTVIVNMLSIIPS